MAQVNGYEIKPYANLYVANLTDADLVGADLRGADLRGADLRGTNLTGADLRGADLRGANLLGADLTDADLRGASLTGADLRGVKNLNPLIVAQTSIVPESGSYIAWKKCQGDVIVKLEIPAHAQRSNATGRKCRASEALVLEVIGATVGVSTHDGRTEYRAGEVVKCGTWEADRWIECAGGIHHFITRIEAENY